MKLCRIALAGLAGCLAGGLLQAAAPPATADRTSPDESAPAAGLVRVDRVAPRVLLDLRYASDRNVLGRALYGPDHRALLRPEVARQLGRADANLREFGYRLVLLDAWRPLRVQRALLSARGARGYVEADPDRAIHAIGVAVDVTLADARGRELPMPTAWDHFGPESGLPYRGGSPEVRHNLGVLQKGMGSAGFVGCAREWWHFVFRPQAGSRTAPRQEDKP